MQLVGEDKSNSPVHAVPLTCKRHELHDWVTMLAEPTIKSMGRVLVVEDDPPTRDLLGAILDLGVFRTS